MRFSCSRLRCSTRLYSPWWGVNSKHVTHPLNPPPVQHHPINIQAPHPAYFTNPGPATLHPGSFDVRAVKLHHLSHRLFLLPITEFGSTRLLEDVVVTGCREHESRVKLEMISTQGVVREGWGRWGIRRCHSQLKYLTSTSLSFCYVITRESFHPKYFSTQNFLNL